MGVGGVALAAELVRWLGLVFGRVLRDIGGARLILLAKVVGKLKRGGRRRDGRSRLWRSDLLGVVTLRLRSDGRVAALVRHIKLRCAPKRAAQT